MPLSTVVPASPSARSSSSRVRKRGWWSWVRDSLRMILRSICSPSIPRILCFPVVRLALYRLFGEHLLLAVLLEDLVVAPQHGFATRVEPQALNEHPSEEGHHEHGQYGQSPQHGPRARSVRSDHDPYSSNHVVRARVICEDAPYAEAVGHWTRGERQASR